MFKKLYKSILIVDFDEIDKILYWFKHEMTPFQESLFVYMLTIVSMSLKHSSKVTVSPEFQSKINGIDEQFGAICLPAIDINGINFGKGNIIIFKESERKGLAKLLSALKEAFAPKTDYEERMDRLGFNKGRIPLPYVSTSANSKMHILRGKKVNVIYSKNGQILIEKNIFDEIFPLNCGKK
jgi:hypothetical protein